MGPDISGTAWSITIKFEYVIEYHAQMTYSRQESQYPNDQGQTKVTCKTLP